MKAVFLIISCLVFASIVKASDFNDEDPTKIVDGKPVEGDAPDPTDIVDGKPVEGDEPDKKYLINGEQLGADDFDQDSTITDGAEQADEMLLPAEDYGSWKKHPYSWCTVQGRQKLSGRRGVPQTFKQCAAQCDKTPGCKAIELWHKYNWNCYWCKRIDWIRPYTNTRDLAYPAHVWVKLDKPAECTRYQVLNDFTRAQGNRRALYRCDNTLAAKPTWYRFTGRSGSQMPTSCVPTNRCGTHAPGWLAGCHPPPGEISTVLVCFHWHRGYGWNKRDDCCRWHTFIRVRNCGGFFVYELKRPPACYLRYCGNSVY